MTQRERAHAEHEAFIAKWGLTYAGGSWRGAYVGPGAARAAALRRLRTSPLTTGMPAPLRRAVVRAFMAGPTRGLASVVLPRWLDALEDYAWRVAHGYEAMR